jgi:hypothetical protein
MALGTAVVTEVTLYNIKKVSFAWTAGTAGAPAQDGAVTKATTYSYAGQILRAVTVPGLLGDAPSADYDITLTDANGIDVAAGLLLNRHTSATQWVTSGMGAVAGDILTINVSAAGSAKKGTLHVYIGNTPETASPTEDIEQALYGATGVVVWPTAAAPANNVSIAEVLGYISTTQLGAQLSGAKRLARRTYSFAVDTGAAGTYAMFTVTGTVLVEVFGVCQADLTTGGGAATIELGITGNTAALIAQTLATGLDQYQLWQDAAPDANPGGVDLTARSYVITNGADINLKITTANLSAGVIDFYCLWTPLSTNGNVTAV